MYVLMTLELANHDFKPGYEGVLEATRHPALANRFHFWRGPSGRRYACTLFGVDAIPSYQEAVALFVRRGWSEPCVVAVTASIDRGAAPAEADEIHVHLVQGGPDALIFALRDLTGLIASHVTLRGTVEYVERRAA